MKILALQLKRIGDLILTTPALRRLREAQPECRLTLAVSNAGAQLIDAMPFVDHAAVVGRGESGRLWRSVLFSRYDVCLDFTGTDRSALLALASMSGKRVAFERVKRSRIRALAYNHFVDSPVRDRHTVDHYLDLLVALKIQPPQAPELSIQPPEWAEQEAQLQLERLGIGGDCVIVHPGTARQEKYWEAARWAAVIDHIQQAHGLPCLITGGDHPFERAHVAAIFAACRSKAHDLSARLSLLALAALARRARLFLSVDSGPMHLAAAAGAAQIALFGKTNPFHWRPRHARAMVLFGGADGAEATFQPRLASRPTSAISTGAVIRATDTQLQALSC